ncbi:hypothetical protein [Luteolibacter sp. LG18]
MKTRSYTHDDPVFETSPRGHSGYGMVHVAGLATVAAVLASAMMMS